MTAVRQPAWTQSALPELADLAAQQWTGTFNPRPFDAAGALEIYRAALLAIVSLGDASGQSRIANRRTSKRCESDFSDSAIRTRADLEPCPLAVSSPLTSRTARASSPTAAA